MADTKDDAIQYWRMKYEQEKEFSDEMLEALEFLLSQYDKVCHSKDVCPYRRKAIEVIRKAKGE